MKERDYWVAWLQIKGLGPVLLKRMWQHFGEMAIAWEAPYSAFLEIEGFGRKLVEQVMEQRSQLDPLQIIETHQNNNPQFWIIGDAEYPRLLLEIPSPPPILYYQGKPDLLENQGVIPCVGIVGTRHPSDHGKRWTEQVSGMLAQSQITVISGMAQGIDGIAHHACVEKKSRTIAVLGTGVDVVYPAGHRPLYNQIQQNGLVMSEYPAGTKPDRSHFPARNRIIAGLSRAVLVMEAPTRSGSLITAHYALEFNREVYALPNSPEQQQAQGCLELIRRGATMIWDEQELLESLGGMPQLDPKQQQLSLFNPSQPAPAIAPECLPVWQAIASGNGGTPFEVIIETSGLPSSQVSGLLLQLELDGHITQLPGMRYQRT